MRVLNGLENASKTGKNVQTKIVLLDSKMHIEIQYINPHKILCLNIL
jgi:hypothetical protein